MSDLGFLWAYAVMEVLGYDAGAVVQPELDVDPAYRTACLSVFWEQSDADAEAQRLNRANASRPVHHLVRQTMVEIRPGDPRFTGLFGGAVYVSRRDDDDLQPGGRRYDCHWEVEPTPVWTGGFDSAEEAIAWGRKRAPSVTVQIGGSDHYSAGESDDDLPRWPPEGWQET